MFQEKRAKVRVIKKAKTQTKNTQANENSGEEYTDPNFNSFVGMDESEFNSDLSDLLIKSFFKYQNYKLRNCLIFRNLLGITFREIEVVQ